MCERDKMKVTEEGTTNIIKWYQPESAKECDDIDCRKCIFNRYLSPEEGCQFRQYLEDYPIMSHPSTSKPLSEYPNYKPSPNVYPNYKSPETRLRLAEEEKANEHDKLKEITDTQQLHITQLKNQIEIMRLRKVVDNMVIVVKYDHAQSCAFMELEVDKYTQKSGQLGYEVVPSGHTGNLYNLPSMPNANEPEYGKDFYHRCIKKGRRLVGLIYDSVRDEHICPLCKEVYLPK